MECYSVVTVIKEEKIEDLFFFCGTGIRMSIIMHHNALKETVKAYVESLGPTNL